MDEASADLVRSFRRAPFAEMFRSAEHWTRKKLLTNLAIFGLLTTTILQIIDKGVGSIGEEFMIINALFQGISLDIVSSALQSKAFQYYLSLAQLHQKRAAGFFVLLIHSKIII